MANFRAKVASVVVLNLDGMRHLPALLAHLAAQTVRDFELVFVDNGSQDESVPLVSQSCRAYGIDLHLVRNQANLGFAAGCNQGLHVAESEWVVMLNNDTRPEPRWLEWLLHTAERQPGVGMVASKMLFAHNPGQINSAGIALDWMGIAWDWRGGEPDDLDEQAEQEIFGPCGGAALYSRQMMLALGGYDEDFFAYLEDVDLAWRARLAGWHCLFQPRARVLHAHSATLGDGSPLKRFLLGRNKVWMLAKDYPNPWLGWLWPSILSYDVLAVGYGMARRRDMASLRGRLAGLRTLPAVLRKRQAVQRSVVDVNNWRRFLSPQAPPWAVPGRYRHLAGK